MNRITDLFKEYIFAFERTRHVKYEESKFITPNNTFFTHIDLFMERDPYKRKDDPHLRNNFVIHKVFGDFDNYYEKLYDANYFTNSDNSVDPDIMTNEFEDDENLLSGFHTILRTTDISWDTDIYCHCNDDKYKFNERIY